MFVLRRRLGRAFQTLILARTAPENQLKMSPAKALRL